MTRITLLMFALVMLALALLTVRLNTLERECVRVQQADTLVLE